MERATPLRNRCRRSFLLNIWCWREGFEVVVMRELESEREAGFHIISLRVKSTLPPTGVNRLFSFFFVSPPPRPCGHYGIKQQTITSSWQIEFFFQCRVCTEFSQRHFIAGNRRPAVSVIIIMVLAQGANSDVKMDLWLVSACLSLSDWNTAAEHKALITQQLHQSRGKKLLMTDIYLCSSLFVEYFGGFMSNKSTNAHIMAQISQFHKPGLFQKKVECLYKSFCSTLTIRFWFWHHMYIWMIVSCCHCLSLDSSASCHSSVISGSKWRHMKTDGWGEGTLIEGRWEEAGRNAGRDKTREQEQSGAGALRWTTWDDPGSRQTGGGARGGGVSWDL